MSIINPVRHAHQSGLGGTRSVSIFALGACMILSMGAAGLLCQDTLLHDCLRDAEYDIGVESGMNDIDGFIELTKLSKYEIESRLLN